MGAGSRAKNSARNLSRKVFSTQLVSYLDSSIVTRSSAFFRSAGSLLPTRGFSGAMIVSEMA